MIDTIVNVSKGGFMEWEYFLDVCYYDMWCVRPKDDRNFNSLRNFHLHNKEDAEQLCSLLNKAIGVKREE